MLLTLNAGRPLAVPRAAVIEQWAQGDGSAIDNSGQVGKIPLQGRASGHGRRHLRRRSGSQSSSAAATAAAAVRPKWLEQPTRRARISQKWAPGRITLAGEAGRTAAREVGVSRPDGRWRHAAAASTRAPAAKARVFGRSNTVVDGIPSKRPTGGAGRSARRAGCCGRGARRSFFTSEPVRSARPFQRAASSLSAST